MKNSAWKHGNAVLKTLLFKVGELQMAGSFAASNPFFLTPRTSSSSRGAAPYVFPQEDIYSLEGLESVFLG